MSAPNLRKWKDALLREDGADQNGDQQNDRHGLPSHALKMVDHRGEPEGRRTQEHPLQRDHHRSDHLREQEKVVADRRHGHADAFQCGDDGVLPRRLGRQLSGCRHGSCRTGRGNPRADPRVWFRTLGCSRCAAPVPRARRRTNRAGRSARCRWRCCARANCGRVAASTSGSSACAYSAVHDPVAASARRSPPDWPLCTVKVPAVTKPLLRRRKSAGALLRDPLRADKRGRSNGGKRCGGTRRLRR